MTELLAHAVLAGLAGGGLAALLRLAGEDYPALSAPLRWVASGKPFTCPVCLGSWSALAATWALQEHLTLTQLLVSVSASMGLGAWLASQLAPWTPPDLPE